MRWLRRSPDDLRTRLLRQCPNGPVADYLRVPFPALRTPLDDAPLLAIDFETTGLDPTTDRLLSIGFVPVDGREIRLRGARHMIIHADTEVGRSATIHGITDDALATGVPLREALEQTLEALRGRVLLAHFARIETEFLSAACRAEFRAEPAFIVADTLWLGQSWLEQRLGAIPRGHLRLWALRERLALPRYKAHNALTDALAAAELYLALTDELGHRRLAQVHSR